MTNDWFTLAKDIGRLEAQSMDHERRLSKLEERPRREPIPWKDLAPYLYGIVMIVAALIAVLTGKLSAIDAIRAIGERPPV